MFPKERTVVFITLKKEMLLSSLYNHRYLQKPFVWPLNMHKDLPLTRDLGSGGAIAPR